MSKRLVGAGQLGCGGRAALAAAWMASAFALAMVGCGEDDRPAAAVVGGADSGVDDGTPDDGTPDDGTPDDGTPDDGTPDDAGTAPVSGECSAGETRACVRDLLCSGVQTCSSSGVYGECDCGETPLDGSPALVGARCEADADCPGGGTCLRADQDTFYGSGGAAGGYCSFTCGSTADCVAQDPQSDCVSLGPDDVQYCIRTCFSQDPEPGEAKCLNREELACLSVAAETGQLSAERQEGFCVPRCGSDAECPEGRVCHRQAGICSTVRSPGAPAGARCTLTSECDGRMCEELVDGVGECTSLCVLGSLSGCGYGADAPLREAACLQPLVSSTQFSEGSGDLGVCRELCDVDADCQSAADGWVCVPLTESFVGFFGRSGACRRSG